MNAKLLVGAFAVVATVGISSSALYQYGTVENDVEFTVTDKERISYSCGENDTCHKYLVTTEDNKGNVEVFENTDTKLHWKFNSSTLQGQLKEDCSFKADVYGWRIGWMSQYRNITEATKVSCSGDTTPAANANEAAKTLKALKPSNN